MLQIQTNHLQPDIVVLEIAGRITIGRDCKHLEWAVDSLVREQQKKIIFDLTGVTHIDSTGIGVAGATGHVEQVLKMTNVHQILGLHPTAVAAAASF